MTWNIYIYIFLNIRYIIYINILYIYTILLWTISTCFHALRRFCGISCGSLGFCSIGPLSISMVTCMAVHMRNGEHKDTWSGLQRRWNPLLIVIEPLPAWVHGMLADIYQWSLMHIRYTLRFLPSSGGSPKLTCFSTTFHRHLLATMASIIYIYKHVDMEKEWLKTIRRSNTWWHLTSLDSPLLLVRALREHAVPGVVNVCIRDKGRQYIHACTHIPHAHCTYMKICI